MPIAKPLYKLKRTCCSQQVGTQRGFSLVRFLVVVTILGFIFKLGLQPKLMQWQAASTIADSTLKPTVEVTNKVVEHYYSEFKLASSNEELDLPAPKEFASKRIEAIEVGKGGVITIRLNEFGANILQGDDYLMMPYMNEYDKIVWRCEAGTLHPRYLPMHCGNKR